MIKTVCLKNFKKYSHKTIHLNDGVTLLVGGNNEGKQLYYMLWQYGDFV